MDNGKVVKRGVLTGVNAAPGTVSKVRIDADYSGLKGEVILEVNASLKENTLWASKGFEIAWEQFTLQIKME